MKKAMLLISLLTLALIFNGCGNTDETTTPVESAMHVETTMQIASPEETTVPATEDTTEQILEHPMNNDFVATGFTYAQGEAYEMNCGTEAGLMVAPCYDDVYYWYTGDSAAIELTALNAVLTLPEEWLDDVYVIQHTYGLNCNTGEVLIVNRALLEAHKENADAENNVLYGMQDYMVKIWTDEKKESYYGDYDPRAEETFIGENETHLFYLLTSENQSAEGSEQQIWRGMLVDGIGQEAYDALVGELIVGPEKAESMISIHGQINMAEE